jgi:tetratricopeptide (TPR) repeat protein
MSRKTTDLWAILVVLLALAPNAYPQKAAVPSSPLAAAQAQLAKKNLDAAETSVWAVLSNDPNSLEGLLLLGTIRQQQQRFAEAEALFRRVLQLDPASAMAHKQLGRALIAQNKTDQAVEFQQAITANPKDNEARIELARLYVSKEDFSNAAIALQDVPSANLPTSAVPVKAAVLLGMKRSSEAVALIPRVARSVPASLDLAEVFVNAKLPDPALRTLAQVNVTKPAARFYYLRASAESLKGDLAGTTRDLKQALAVDPNSVPALIATADIASGQKRSAEAVGYLERAYALDPNSIPVLRRMVEQAMASQLHGLVEKYAFELEHKSSLPEDVYLAGAALLQEREYPEAARLFEIYTAQHTHDSKAFFALGLARLNDQRYEDSRRALEKALELDPKLTEAEYSLGILFLKEGDNQAALAHFERVLKAQPKHAGALLNSGMLYLQEGVLEKAKAALSTCETVDGNNPDLQYQLSLLYKRLGNTEEAQLHLERFRVLKLDAERSGIGKSKPIVK